MSSRHSHQSVLSAHAGPQSNHVAQHLRRMSIIESRKARLADRAAHAEKVRLRAALAKAAPRGTSREDRALAAQAAREKLLAEITARCEEEVRRAKRVAEENKEKKAAELIRLREEMEGKLAEAAKRRLEYQQSIRRPRTASLPRVEEKKAVKPMCTQLSHTAAAKIIQRHWKAYNAVRIAKAFNSLQLSVPRLKAMDFDDVGGRLSSERALVATARTLKFFGMLENADDELGDRGSVRVFLSTFLVLSHPGQVLSHGGSDGQEQELLSKAEELLTCFEKALKRIIVAKQPHAHENLSFLFHSFTSTFHAWKSRDSGALIDIMVNQFVELDLILQTVKDDKAGGAADEYHSAIRTFQVQLLARLKRFAGPEKALDLVRTAVRKARKRHAKARRAPSPNDIPRTASTGDEGIQRIAHEALSNTEVVPQKQSPSLADQSALLVRELRQSMTPIPSNREVSHEILVNGFFEVQQRPWTESRKAFSDSLRTGMRETLEQGGDLAASGWIGSMATLIRERLLNLVTQRHPLYERIDNFLDTTLIDQTCRAGMFSYESFFETIGNIIAQICSPGRDDAVNAFLKDRNSDHIDRLFNLVDILDLMSLDHINYAFRMAAPTVLEHGLEHERAVFESEVSEGRIPLEKTRTFWQRSRSALLDEGRARDSLAAGPSGPAIYMKGLTDLILANQPLEDELIPETLQLDGQRLSKLRATAYKMAAVASILLTTKIRLRRNREVRWSADADRIMALDFADPKTHPQRVVSIIESSHLMPDATRDGLLSFVNRVLPPAIAAARRAEDPASHLPSDTQSSTTEPTATFTEPLALHLLRSLQSHIHARLSATSTAERVRVTTSAAETLARAGMPEFVAEVGKVVDILERVKRVDLAAHSVWYDQVAGRD